MSVNPLLSGIRVLDLSRLLPGPFCTLYLAQMGAEVIKIEEPEGGDYARGMGELFALVNRGKKSVTLDLRREPDRAQLRELVKTADVLIESFRPGVMERFDCGYESLKQINPKLVYAALTGYGQTGPYRDWAGHDMNYLAIAGVMDQIGRAGGAPAQSNLQIADLAGGALTCALGILAAVIGARASGRGSYVDVSMTDGALALQPIALAALRAEGRAPVRGAALLTGALPNYTVYRCRDGRYLAVGALEPKFFIGLLKVLGDTAPAPLQRILRQALGKRGGATTSADGKTKSADKDPFGKLGRVMADPRRARRVLAPLRWALQALFLTRTRDDWSAMLAARDVCVTPILSLDEALQNEQLRARGMIEEVDGKPAFALPILFSDQPAAVGPAPALGADTREVLAALKKPAKPAVAKKKAATKKIVAKQAATKKVTKKVTKKTLRKKPAAAPARKRRR
ncbi:MAG TPA: CaiB/BaiF CoA-transferase family protein [Solimonas sp.]|nr:CaiB/BaiF CoA-transferase family protein [Solimonas sp.]